jgi:hypothetical protein
MERFNKSILIGEESRLFQFTKMQNMEGVKFFITSFDLKNKPISFSMKKNKLGDWALLPGSLPWLYQISSELQNAILEKQPA